MPEEEVPDVSKVDSEEDVDEKEDSGIGELEVVFFCGRDTDKLAA